MDWALRPVGSADEAFLLRVYAGTRADELALTSWDEATRETFVRMQAHAQAAHYQAHWPEAEHTVITLRQGRAWQDVGRLWLHRRADAVHVLDIALLPEWRSQGLGRRVLQHLMADAEAQGRVLTIYVEAGNSARRLYDRLGFEPVGQSDGVHQFMRWRRVTTKAMETCNEQA
jgi:ribosomal protein S18 acetylase RimI-like enzyme